MNRQRKNQIKEMEHQLKITKQNMVQDRLSDVRSTKAFQIKDEIRKISRKDHEARMLEKREDLLLTRLKETHALQQDTLSQIQDIFSSQYLNE